MKVLIKTSNPLYFQRNYPKLCNDPNVTVKDGIRLDSLNATDIVLAVVTFVFESSVSGLTWDIVQQNIRLVLSKLAWGKKKIEKYSFNCEIDGNTYYLDIPDGKDVEIEIPDKLKVIFLDPKK